MLVFLALALAAPAHARSQQIPQTKAQRQALKDWKKWNKQQAKILKQQLKAQSKAMKNWGKTHPKRSVTG